MDKMEYTVRCQGGRGLGFRKLQEFNVAMLAKQAWRLINNTNPLVSGLMKARYYVNTDFLEAKLGDNPSFMWRSIMASQEIVRQHCRRKIGDGKDTRVWHIPWLPCKDNGCPTTTPYEELQDIVVHNLMNDEHKSWDVDILHDLFNERDRVLIQQIPIPSRSRSDSWYWQLDDKGVFSVKSCYRSLRGENTNTEGGFWKQVWGLKLPGKVINLVWRACKNVLPTASELIKRYVAIDSMCPWCHLQCETPVHTLFTCSFAKELWDKVGLQDISPVDEDETVLQILVRVFKQFNREKRVVIGLFLWSIWFRRNMWVWNKQAMSVFGVHAMALQLLQDWKRSQEHQDQEERRKQQMSSRQWRKPQEGWVKVNIDAACRDHSGVIGMGCIVRDDRGEFVRARSATARGGMPPREAEAWSFRAALLWMKSWRTQKCIFELDAKTVVDAVHGTRGNSIFHTIIEECEDILKHFQEVLVVFENRSANRVAHVLAQAAYSMSGPMEWVDTAPDFLLCNLISDNS